MTRKATIQDIAHKSGVSVSTVSLALNNKPGVSAKTRSRVFDAADELEYPLRNAPTPGRYSSLSTVGMIVKTDPQSAPQANPFYSKVILGIEDGCRRNGINLLFSTLPVDENNHPLEVPQLLFADSVDGLLMVGTMINKTIATLSGKRLPPIVLVDGYSNTDSYDSVISDNFSAAYQAVGYLIHKGHRHIGMVGGNINCYPSLKERRNGYFRALSDHEITTPYIANFNINQTNGYQESQCLLQEHPQITALFCINDEIASTALRAAQTLGKRVPEDISLIGYDGTYISTHTRPTLTTMHVDTIAMGHAGVSLLSLRCDNPDSARMTLTIHPALVERESVCPPSHPSENA